MIYAMTTRSKGDVIIKKQANNLEEAIDIVSSKHRNLQGVIIEPIQSTYGDKYLNKLKLKN